MHSMKYAIMSPISNSPVFDLLKELWSQIPTKGEWCLCDVCVYRPTNWMRHTCFFWSNEGNSKAIRVLSLYFQILFAFKTAAQKHYKHKGWKMTTAKTQIQHCFVFLFFLMNVILFHPEESFIAQKLLIMSSDVSPLKHVWRNKTLVTGSASKCLEL